MIFKRKGLWTCMESLYTAVHAVYNVVYVVYNEPLYTMVHIIHMYYTIMK